MDTFYIAIVVSTIIIVPTLTAPVAYWLELKLAERYEARYGRKWPLLDRSARW
jgi:hypothetical protein